MENNIPPSVYARICRLHNLQPDKNAIGTSGENFVAFVLNYFPFFNVFFLDGKAPIEDFFCEINDEGEPYPFLVQVKSTTTGTDDNGNLQTPLPEDKKQKLIARPIPTYLAGVDIDKMEVYLAPVFDPGVKYSTVKPNHVLKLKNRVRMANEIDLLKMDVRQYWYNSGIVAYKPSYQSVL